MVRQAVAKLVGKEEVQDYRVKRVRPNKTLKLTGAAISVPRDIKVLQATPAA